jgi:hypothetical protein
VALGSRLNNLARRDAGGPTLTVSIPFADFTYCPPALGTSASTTSQFAKCFRIGHRRFAGEIVADIGGWFAARVSISFCLSAAVIFCLGTVDSNCEQVAFFDPSQWTFSADCVPVPLSPEHALYSGGSQIPLQQAPCRLVAMSPCETHVRS